ncbi:MAG: hypothetical protein ACK6BG_14895 [Cyanobacteriota bacterium]
MGRGDMGQGGFGEIRPPSHEDDAFALLRNAKISRIDQLAGDVIAKSSFCLVLLLQPGGVIQPRLSCLGLQKGITQLQEHVVEIRSE